ncbi:pilus assembly protein [Thioalkalivibrio nitratireducens DSM 14787]|uniref:Type II secretion system protein H n=1 Tax=Thioalkalivibrio nitratireducens (strain DSM 14787 / UNIQEM 213 / ALEN2) TaxID=1255043 RepID=L0DTB5_THIND|nr:GspH/FimT family pseudopilin [Thioalkalivibrio nitratireducens]AGA32235.1 pilus assembly protein [Thioalkalivibrio nitratireducens DSM 14787]
MIGNSQSGFTLIELIITIVVLVVLVTLAAPSFVDVLDRRRIVDAAETLMKQVQQARAVAIESNREISMVFDDSGTTWCFGLTAAAGCDCYESDPSEPDSCQIPFGALVNLAGTDFELIRASGNDFPGVTLQNFPAALRFEPMRGVRVDAAGPTVTIEFVSARDREAHVVVNRLGRAGTCSPADAGGDPSVTTMRLCP